MFALFCFPKISYCSLHFLGGKIKAAANPSSLRTSPPQDRSTAGNNWSVESAATELEVVGCSSESPTKAAYKRKVAELGNIIEKKIRCSVPQRKQR
ncbi:hypothetical protein AVEN_23106-1 [Araneus ventricosus]|uniref:Uncharacterized protein n=1 Tax=Araneus ventricosus TaxID=182803 RepID=A0A4Y2IMF1_ARAVE|nr:hypothetical protein AVEN_23106-1 [Araneus ventricosus]